jgi:hypothetical protein
MYPLEIIICDANFMKGSARSNVKGAHLRMGKRKPLFLVCKRGSNIVKFRPQSNER